MRRLYNPANYREITKIAKGMSIEHNVTLNVIDEKTGKIVQTHEGHNAATNSMLTGIAHYLVGDGVYNQAYDMLSMYVPKYISLGTMGLFTQAEDENHLPIGLGYDLDSYDPDAVDEDGNKLYYGDPQTERLCHYMSEVPGFGADGYDLNENNGRPYLGLGPKFEDRDFEEVISCELISDVYPRNPISFREIIPEHSSEIPKTIDIVYSGMVSVASLSQFRGNTNGMQNNYIFITEAGLWSKKNWTTGENGLLAGYRLAPPSGDNWNMGTFIDGYEEPNPENPNETVWIPGHYDLDYEIDPETGERKIDPETGDYILSDLGLQQKENQLLLQKNILRVGVNQVVQVIWKIQLGGLEQFGGQSALYMNLNDDLLWHFWDNRD